jgi:transposase-like protein
MSDQSVTPEVRAKVLMSVKDEGISIETAAQTYNLHPDTIRKWLRLTADNSHTSSTDRNPLPRAALLNMGSRLRDSPYGRPYRQT